jgi:N-acetylglucosamine-6-phosphate deacetylase
MIRLAKRELGDKLFLITDAVTSTNEGAYQHRLAGNKYVMPDGTLSGSSLTMLKAVENCVKQAGIELAEAVNMASLYPAELAKQDKKGKIEKNFIADMVVFNADFEVEATYLNGHLLTKTT